MKSLEVHLHTNTSCNLHCIHCYNNSKINAKQDIPDVKALYDTIDSICSSYQAEIHLEGGEIFLRPELLSEMNKFSDDVLEKITITTNGSFFYDNPKIINMLKRLAYLRISVEGHMAEQHEAIRGGSFDTVIQNAKKYQELNIPVCLRITLNKLNYHNFISKTILGLADMGFRDFQVYEFQSVGRGNESKQLLSLNHPLTNLFEEMYDTPIPDIQLKMMFSSERKAEILDAKRSLATKSYKVCEIQSEAGISIHANGDVYRCAWDNNPANVLCNWYNDENALNFIQSSDLAHTCSHCSAFCIALKRP